MKILQVGPDSVHVTSYLSALSTLGHEVYWLTENTVQNKDVKEVFTINFRKISVSNWFSKNSELKKLLKHLKPDVIHVHQLNRAAYLVTRMASKLGIPVISTAWGSDVLLVPKKNPLYAFLVKQAMRRSAIVTADSAEMIEVMDHLVPAAGKYRFLQYGIDPIEAQQKEQIIYSNRLHEPLYRIDRIVHYFNDFLKINPEWKLVIAGSGSETEVLKRLVYNLNITNSVNFVGWLDKSDNREYYARSMMYVSIPESDGTSVSLLEAMSAGCIPVVSDLAVSREWITDGLNGIIEKTGENPLEFAQTIDSDACRKINKQLISEKATRAASLKQFDQFYTELNNDK